MRFRRGMFRLWIVASVIWIALIGVIGYREWRAVQEPVKLYLLRDATSDFYTVENVFTAFDPNVQKEYLISEYPHGITLMIPNSVSRDVAESKKKEFEHKYVETLTHDFEQKRSETAATYLEAALLPPLAFLAFGSAMAWAFTGFRRD